MDLLDQMLAEAEADFNVNEHDELDKVWHILNWHPPQSSQQKHVATFAARGNTHLHTSNLHPIARAIYRGHVQRMYTTNLNQRQNYTTKNYQALAERSPASLRKDGTHIPAGLHDGASNSELFSKISAAHPPVVPSFMVVGASDRGWQVDMYESAPTNVYTVPCMHSHSINRTHIYPDEQDTKHIWLGNTPFLSHRIKLSTHQYN